jgi:hypothetical protein
MKYFLSIISLMLSWLVSAQDNSLLDRMCDNVASSCVSLDYSYTARVSGIDKKASGTLMSQDENWTLKGNGVDMYCDGSTVWVVDPALKEVVIESLEDERQTEFLTNPARIVVGLRDSFKVNTANPSSDGKSVVFSLVPLKGGDVEYLNVDIYKDTALIRNMSFAMKDGTLVKIEVSSMKLTPKVSDEAFRPQTVFDSKWIITDLR